MWWPRQEYPRLCRGSGAGGTQAAASAPHMLRASAGAAIPSLCRDMQAAADSWCIPDWLCGPSRARGEETGCSLVPLGTLPDEDTSSADACTGSGPGNSTAHLSERAWCPPGAHVHDTSGCWCGGPWASCWGPGGPGCLSWHLWSLHTQHRSSRQVGHLCSLNTAHHLKHCRLHLAKQVARVPLLPEHSKANTAVGRRL